MTSIVAWNFCRVELIIFSPFVCLYRRIIQWDIKAADAILVCSLRNESGNTEEVAGGFCSVQTKRQLKLTFVWRQKHIHYYIGLSVLEMWQGVMRCFGCFLPFLSNTCYHSPLSHCFVPKALLLWRISETCRKAVIIPNVSTTWLLI